MGVLICDMPPMAPYKCVSCSSGYGGDGRKFVDTGIHIDHFGQIYICQHCMVQIAREINIIPWIPQRDLELRVGNLEEENVRLRTALASLDFVPNRSGNSFVPEPTPGDEDSSGDVEGGKAPSKRASKSSTKPDTGSVRGASKLDELLSK